jgi:hypothetical protein
MEPWNKKTHQDLAHFICEVHAEAVGTHGIPLQSGWNKKEKTSRTRDPTEQDHQRIPTRIDNGGAGTTDAVVFDQ